jgi:hypothetical protein
MKPRRSGSDFPWSKRSTLRRRQITRSTANDSPHVRLQNCCRSPPLRDRIEYAVNLRGPLSKANCSPLGETLRRYDQSADRNGEFGQSCAAEFLIRNSVLLPTT